MTQLSKRQRRVFCGISIVAWAYVTLLSRWGISTVSWYDDDDDINNNNNNNNNNNWNPTKPTQQKQQPLSFNAQYIRLHSLDHAILDLMEWEINSTTDHYSPASCQPPNGVPDYCCLGAGQHTHRNLCDNVTVDQYHQIRDDAARVLHSLPLSNATTSRTIQCDICQIVEIAKDHQLHIAFLGDSAHHEIVERLVCNLARRNYTVNRTIVRDTRQTEKKTVTFRWMAELHYTVRSPLWQNKSQVVQFRVWRQYKMAVKLPEINENIHELEQIYNWPDVLILGFGLHYQYNTRWGQDSKQAFLEKTSQFINSRHRNQTTTTIGNQSWVLHNKKRPAVWMIREPSMQHFAPAGDYSHRGDYDVTCVPYFESQQYLKDNNLSLQISTWRRDTIHDAITKFSNATMIMANERMPPKNNKQQPPTTNTNEIIVLPFTDWTKPYHYMHPHRPRKQLWNPHRKFPPPNDCTHYCGSPFLHLPLSRYLRYALEREFLDPNT